MKNKPCIGNISPDPKVLSQDFIIPDQEAGTSKIKELVQRLQLYIFTPSNRIPPRACQHKERGQFLDFKWTIASTHSRGGGGTDLAPEEGSFNDFSPADTWSHKSLRPLATW